MTKTIAILVTDDFEDSELQVPYDRLREEGHGVLIVGPTADKIIAGKQHHYQTRTDVSVDAVSPADFDALVIPGGYSPDRLRLNTSAVSFVRDFGRTGKPVAAICHAAQLLISANLVKGKTLTCWPSIALDVTNAGGNYVDRPIVVDGNLITSRKPDDLTQFIDAVILALADHEDRLSA